MFLNPSCIILWEGIQMEKAGPSNAGVPKHSKVYRRQWLHGRKTTFPSWVLPWVCWWQGPVERPPGQPDWTQTLSGWVKLLVTKAAIFGPGAGRLPYPDWHHLLKWTSPEVPCLSFLWLDYVAHNEVHKQKRKGEKKRDAQSIYGKNNQLAPQIKLRISRTSFCHANSNSA